ncbi:MAG TPA: AMP-binding protein, partial [Polyangia bacterium]
MAFEFQTLQEGLRRSLAVNRAATALEVDGKSVSYQELADASSAVCDAIVRLDAKAGGLVAVFGYRSRGAYAGIVGIVLSGNGYVPLNPRFPADRLRTILARSGCETIVLYEECADAFAATTAGGPALTVICPEPGERCKALLSLQPQHRYCFLTTEKSAATGETIAASLAMPEMSAYLLFTSGSTGVPKGVAVTHENVCAYLRTTIERYQIACTDRHTQMFDLTFDLSVHDIFVTLLAGACLCVVPESAVMGPAKFLAERACTVSFCVPSVAMFMDKMRMLKTDRFPALRLSLFCGEALSARSVQLWQAAAPNAVIENI